MNQISGSGNPRLCFYKALGDSEPENDQVVNQPNDQKGFLGPSQTEGTVTSGYQPGSLAELSEIDLGECGSINQQNKTTITTTKQKSEML